MSEATPAVNDASFEADVLKSEIPVVVDLWAPWCGPCRAIAPILEELAPTFAGKLKIVKLNVDENSQTAAKFNVMNIPTMIFFKGGNEVDRLVGVLPKAELEQKFKDVIGS